MADLTTRRVRAAAGIVAAFLVVSVSADSSSEVTAPLASEIVAGAAVDAVDSSAAAVDSSAAAVAPASSAGLDRQDDFARRFIRRIDGDARVFGYRALRAALSAVGDDDASWDEEMSDLGDATADKLFQAAADSATDGLRRGLEGSFIRNLTLSYRSPFSSSGARVSGDALAALWGDADKLLFAQFGGGADFGDDGEDDDSDKYGSVGFGLRGKLGGAILGGNIFGDVTAEGYRRHSFGLEARHRGGSLRANWYFGDAHLADGRTLEASGRVPGLTDWAEFGAEFSQWDNTADDGGDEMEAGYRLSVFPRDGVRLNFKQNKEEGETSSFEVLAEFGWHLDATGLAGAAIRLGDGSELDARLDGIVERDREFRKKTKLAPPSERLASAASASGQVGPDCGSGTANGDDSCVVSGVESSLGALVVTLHADGSCETEIDGEAAVSRRGRLLAGDVNVCESAATAAEIAWSPGFGFGNATAETRILTGTAGEAFSHNLADDFSDAEGDLTCELAAGALPAGLALDETACVLSGTFPAAAGLLSFTIRANEANGTTHSAIYMLNRHPTGETAITVNAVESRVFAYDAAGDFNDADGDYLTCEVKAGSSLPEWLSQGGLGGCALTGTPRTTAPATFTLVIGDGVDGRAEAGYAVSVIAIATAEADEAALREAAKDGDVDEVVRLLDAGNADVNAPGERGFTALIWAARYGHSDVVRALLGVAGIDVNRQKRNGWTALLLAVLNGHTQVAELLLGPLGVAAGIDVNVQNDNGDTALDLVNRHNRESVRERLIVLGGRCNNVCRPPAPPADLTANAGGGAAPADVVLDWLVSTDADGYKIYHDTVGGAALTLLHTIPDGDTATWTHQNAGAGTHSYAIAAVKAGVADSAQSSPPVSAIILVTAVCDRTPQVRDEIVRLSPVSDCADVTPAHLAGIRSLSLLGDGISTLSAGDFSGLSSLVTLRLGGNDLTSLPADVFSGLGSLGSLDLYNNDLTSLLADVFSGLGSLEWLSLGRNDLTSLPAGVFSGLGSLEELRLGGNDLTSLPADVFSGMGSLETLDLGSNDLTSLPADVFSGLGSLVWLDLWNNDLTSLPADVFSGLGSLETLDLGRNDLTSLPADVFSGLGSLDELRLGGNDLTSLPADVFSGLGSLETLDLGSNDLTSLPADVFFGLGSLEELYLINNPVPGGLFNLTLRLTRTDAGDAAAGPAMVRVELAEGAPFDVVVGLSATGGNLSAPTATIPAGALHSEDIRVTYTDGALLSISATPSVLPTNHSGYRFVAGPRLGIGVALPPAGLAATPSGGGASGQVVLTWTASDGATGYKIYHDTVSGTALTLLHTISGGDTATWAHRNAGAGTHFYAIAAVKAGADDSAQSSPPVSATILRTAVCDRTPQVRDEIVELSPVSDCADVTAAHLAGIGRLDLSYDGISALSAGDFSGLSSLVTLDLGGNDLTSLPADVFSGLGSLEWLYLYNNDLTSLSAGVFSGLGSLVLLDLWNNDLTSLPADVFSGLVSLERLDLWNNDLASLPAGVFSGLGSLEMLDLRNNPVPGGLFNLTLQLARTDAGDGAAGPAMVRVKLAEGAPFDVVIGLSATGGNLSAPTATIPAGETHSESVAVTYTDGALLDISTTPSVLPANHRGYQFVAGPPLDIGLP